MGGSSQQDADSLRDVISAPASPRVPTAISGGQDLMQFSPNPTSPKANTSAEVTAAMNAESAESMGIVKQHLEGNIEAVMLADETVPAAKVQLAIPDAGNEPILGEILAPPRLLLPGIHKGNRQSSPERSKRPGSPSTLLVIDEEAQAEVLIGAHHSQRQRPSNRSPKRSPSAQLLMVAETTEIALMGSHRSSRQPPSPHKQPQSAVKVSPPSIGSEHSAISIEQASAADTESLEDHINDQDVVQGTSAGGDVSSALHGSLVAAAQAEATPLAGVLTGSNHGKRQPASPRKTIASTSSQHESDVAQPGTSAVQPDPEAEPLPVLEGVESQMPLHMPEPAAEAVGAGVLTGQHHGKRQKSPKKTSTWLKRVISISKPDAPKIEPQTEAASSMTAQEPEAVEAQSPEMSLHANFAYYPHTAANAAPDAPQFAVTEQLNREEADIDLEAAAVMKAIDTESVDDASSAHDANGIQSEIGSTDAAVTALSRKPSKLSRAGSRLLRTVLSGFSSKTRSTRPGKQGVAARTSSGLDHDIILEEGTGSELSQSAQGAEPEDEGSHQDQMQATRGLTAYHAMEQGGMQEGLAAPTLQALAVKEGTGHNAKGQQAAAAVSPQSVKRSAGSASSLQIDDLLTETPFRAQPPAKPVTNTKPNFLEGQDLTSPSSKIDTAGAESAAQVTASAMPHPLASLQLEDLLADTTFKGSSHFDDPGGQGADMGKSAEASLMSENAAAIPPQAAEPSEPATTHAKFSGSQQSQRGEDMQDTQTGSETEEVDGENIATRASVPDQQEAGSLKTGNQDVDSGENSVDDDLEELAADFLPSVPSAPLAVLHHASG